MTKKKERRTYQPRLVGDKVMMPADLKRLLKYMLEIEHISVISDEVTGLTNMARAPSEKSLRGERP